jgi:tol-pal system protein YbgF
MKNKYLLFLPLCAGVYAEPRALPSVIDKSTYTGGSAYQTGAPSNNALYEVLGRLEQLQLEVQQLRGLVEEQAQTIAALKTRQGNIYSDLDQRLQALSVGGQGVGVPLQQRTVTVKAQPPVSQPPVPESIRTVKKPSVSEKQLYQAAYDQLRNGHNSQAIASFKALLNDYPSGEYADNSQYWLGEAYKVNQDRDSARTAFTKVVELYPNSPKVPDALLKLGYIEFDQKNITKARDYLTQVTVNYPGTTAAHLAAKKLMKLNQQ